MPKRKNENQDNPTSDTSWNYESRVSEIEEIIAQIEAGELDLGNVFDKFSTAIRHLQECEGFLQKHQQEIDLLIETLNPE